MTGSDGGGLVRPKHGSAPLLHRMTHMLRDSSDEYAEDAVRGVGGGWLGHMDYSEWESERSED